MEIKLTLYDLPQWKHNIVTWICNRMKWNFRMNGMTGSIEVYIQ